MYNSSITDQEYERKHKAVARKAATEGFVLLKNEDRVLPIEKGSKVALYGAGASKTIKGGTGSGDVNEKYSVSIYEGLKQAGYQITTEEWIEQYDRLYENARIDWRNQIWRENEGQENKNNGSTFFNIYTSHPFVPPEGEMPEKTDATIAVYVISRVAGEAADRFLKPGDYYLNKEEEQFLTVLCGIYEKIIVLINSGGIIDLSFMDRFSNIKGLMLISQPGMEGGNAVADVISGSVVPSGKLTDTWAFQYEDYPNALIFSHNNGDVFNERYAEGIYVGYRYFDTFEVPVRYCFGYGLSYTNFVMTLQKIQFNSVNQTLEAVIKVKNTGSDYVGKEVVQLYVSCPQGDMEKEYHRLAGFKKTGEIAPGQEEDICIKMSLAQLTSYNEDSHGWVLEKGTYGIFIGNSIEQAEFGSSVCISDTVILQKTTPICPLHKQLDELHASQLQQNIKRDTWRRQAGTKPGVKIEVSDIKTIDSNRKASAARLSEVSDFVDQLSEKQLIELVTGDPGKGQGSEVGSAGISVPGSAAQTSECAREQGLASIVLADGPAGLRLQKKYYIKDGTICLLPIEASLENGFFMKNETEIEGEVRYQHCTAFPVGTLLAQTWNQDLLYEVGQAVSEEMELFGVTVWLAPGMNIHRNPLCGRNFEYFSEDPLLSGQMAAAITRGVQKSSRCSTTIKHFACNNQEDNRMGSDSIISERTLREIYLKGFEIAVNEGHPKAVMTSYNLINGIHAANNYDLCTTVLREEWGFNGVVMTDWTTTHYGPDCTASGCIHAGNDLIMPGCENDHLNIADELKKGTLTLEELKKAAKNIVNLIWQTTN